MALGLNAGNVFLADTWSLDLSTKIWDCLSGSDTVCKAAPAPPPHGPSPRGFSAYQQIGLYLFIFGGISFECVPETGVWAVMNNELWALNIATMHWSPIQTPKLQPAGGDQQFQPSARTQPAIVAYGRQGGLKSPLALIGGADIGCMIKGCPYPIPMDDIWAVDVAHQEAGYNSADLMAEFDGNDIIVVQLPPWCSLVSSMSVLWLDGWIFFESYAALDGTPIMLIDSYTNDNPVLRLYLEGTSSVPGVVAGPNMYLVLVLVSSLAESVTVKRWGPLNSTVLEVWHHFAFTLRFGRVSSQGSCTSPSIVLTQAFMFLDTEPVPDDGNFLSLDIENQLVLNAGIDSFSIGGLNPSIVADTSMFSNFVGAMDNFRIWWPACPPVDDPSRCNPFAFLFPILEDGTRQPSSGIADSQVRLETVARPLLESILLTQIQNITSLLVSLDFDEPSYGGLLTNSATWDGPPFCDRTGQYSAVCDGCPSNCVFAFASQFDVNCLDSGLFVILQEQTSQQFYSDEGVCNCLGIDNCPTQVKNCICPEGLERTCSSCQKQGLAASPVNAGICMSGQTSILCWSDADCAPTFPGVCTNNLLNPTFCPEEYCSEWTCSCSLNGTAVSVGQIASVMTGKGTCSCEQGKELFSMSEISPSGEPYPCCVKEVLGGQICNSWSSGNIPTCLDPPMVSALNGKQDCGVKHCCIAVSTSPVTGPSSAPNPAPPGGAGGQPSSSGTPVTCTLTGLSQGTWVGTFVASASASTPGTRRHVDINDNLGGRTLRDVVFHGLFIPDQEAGNTILDLSPTEKMFKSVAASNEMENAYPSNLQQGVPGSGPQATNARKLFQLDGSSSSTPPILISIMLTVPNTNCMSLCPKISSIYNAIKNVAASAPFGITLTQPNQIASSCDLSCSQAESPKNLALNIGLLIPVTGSQTVYDSKLLALYLSENRLLLQGIELLPGTTATVIYCGDGEKQTLSIGSIQYSEECDDGIYNSLYYGCAPTCKCNQPAFNLDAENVSCICQQNPRVSLSVTESTSVQEVTNILEINVSFADTYNFNFATQQSDVSGGSSVLILTISGLTGTMTQDGILDVDCSIPGLSSIDVCGLGPDLNSSSSTSFRANKALWSQVNGALTFTVLHSFGPAQAALSGWFLAKVPLMNNIYAQDARTPSISTCNGIKKHGEGNVLESNAVEVRGPATYSQKFSVKKASSNTILSIMNITAAPIVKTEYLVLQAEQASLVNKTYTARLPFGAKFAGMLNTAGLNYVMETGSSTSYPDLFVSIAVNRSIIRTQGGCVDSADGNLQICLPGFVGLYMFVDSKNQNKISESESHWKSLTLIDNSSMTVDYLHSHVNQSTLYAVIATPQCNDVNGSGRAGGDRICLSSKDSKNIIISELGGLIMSRMPTLLRSTRPAILTWTDYAQYLKSVDEGSVYVSRTGWFRLCPGGAVITAGECPVDSAAQLAWFPARFGLSLASVRTGRVIIFGGIACQTKDSSTGWCTELELLSDVWELDIETALNGGNGLNQILLKPSTPGVIGQASIVLTDNSQRILIIGGASQSYPFYALTGTVAPAAADAEVFVVQNILLRLGTFSSGSVASVGEISSHSVVLTGSNAIIFGGYARNAPTSATYKYDLAAVTPGLGLSNIFAAASGPNARGYAGLVQQNELTLILFGGVGGAGTSSEGCAGTVVGLWDVWTLDLSSQVWTAVPKIAGVIYPVTTAFSAYAHFTIDTATVLLLHGGIQCGYEPGVTFTGSCPTSVTQLGDSLCSGLVTPSLQAVAINSLATGLEYFTMLCRKATSTSTAPTARCMHAMLAGSFLDAENIILYGGLSGAGEALSDLWYVSSSNLQYGSCVSLRFENTNQNIQNDPDALLLVFKASPGGCNTDGIEIGCQSLLSSFYYNITEDVIEVLVSVTDSQFQACILPFYLKKGLFRNIATRVNSSWAAATLNLSLIPRTGFHVDVRVDFEKFSAISPALGCKTQCVGGFCQPPTGTYSTSPSRCYTGDSDCNTNYTCSIPGGRHGHSMLLFSFAGRSVALLFGGEISDLYASAPRLSAQLFSAFFQGGSVSWVDFPLGFLGADGVEHTCSYSTLHNLGGCPSPRRDAAVVLMDNSGGQNGRMLLFGGMGYCEVGDV